MLTGDVFSFAQIIGYIAYGITAIAYWQKNDKKLFLINALATVFWVWHFGMLGAWAGALTEALVGLRSILSAVMTNPRQRHWAGILLLAAFIIAGAFTCHHWQDWFIVAACSASTVAMIYMKNFALRYGLMVGLFLWLFYGFFVWSIGSIFTSATLIVVQSITLIRMYRDKKRGEKISPL